MSFVFGPIHNITLASGAQAFPEKAFTTKEALLSVPYGQNMSDARLAHLASELNNMLGLENRYWSYLPGPTKIGLDTAQLATNAIVNALTRSTFTAQDIAALFVATSTPTRFTSTVSASVGDALDLTALCMDLRAGCSAGIFGLLQAANYIQAGAPCAALIGADTFSALIQPEHRLSVCVMGDGAAAVILAPGTGTLHALYYNSDPTKRHLVHTPGPMPPTLNAIEQGAYRLQGDSEAFNAQILPRYEEGIAKALAHANMSIDDIDMLIAQQTNVQMLHDIGERIGLPKDKIWTEGVSQHANIGAAGWLSALASAHQQGKTTKGSTILCASVGGGMSWGAAVWTL